MESLLQPPIRIVPPVSTLPPTPPTAENDPTETSVRPRTRRADLRRASLEIAGTVGLLVGTSSPGFRSLGLLLFWAICLRPWTKSRLLFFLSVSTLFTITDALALKRGVFVFHDSDVFGLPIWEMAAWGFYLLHTARTIPAPRVNGPDRLTWALAAAFTAGFTLFPGSGALLASSSLVLAAALFRHHDRWDWAYVGYMAVLGTIIEYAGVGAGVWSYPNPPVGGVPFWYLPMWGGIGFFLRRLMIPLLQRAPSTPAATLWTGIAGLILRECRPGPRLERVPEPPLDRSAFDEEGGDGGTLQGVYLFNARAIHALAPRGASVLDLGCGAGRFAVFLARCRPDLRIVGLDIDDDMLARARRHASREGVDGRVRFVIGDMTNFTAAVGNRFDVVSSMFTLHHLPDAEGRDRCLARIGETVNNGARLWLFDHVRPRQRSTASAFPDVFTPDAPAGFRKNSTDSLIAAWSFTELVESLRARVPGTTGELSRFLPFYQVHWKGVVSADEAPWHPPSVSMRAQRDHRSLLNLFPHLARTHSLKRDARA